MLREIFNNNHKVLNIYLTAGYPDIKKFEELIVFFSENGVDIIEIGIPFTEPVADGEIIQKSTNIAIENNITLTKTFKIIESLRKKIKSKLVFMSYYNPIFIYGEEKFISKLVSVGVDGVIVPDLPAEEGKNFYKMCINAGIETILLITTITPAERIKIISNLTSGFLYLVSVLGTTGVRDNLPDLKSKIKAIKKDVKLPVCVGFGIKSPESILQFIDIVDGIIIGSAIIEIIEKYKKNEKKMFQHLHKFIYSFQKALKI